MSTRMSPLERMFAVILGQKPDRVPVVPNVLGYAAQIVGASLGDFYSDGDLCFEAQMTSMRLHGYDQTPMYVYASCGPWEFGGEVGMPYDNAYGAPYAKRHPVMEIQDIYDLEVPQFKEGALPGAFPQAEKLVRKCVELGMPATVQVGSAFTAASVVADTTKFLKWTFTEPKAMHVLLDKVSDMFINHLEYLVGKYGPMTCMPFDGGPVEANTVLSAKMFEEFVYPYYLKVHKKIRDLGIPAVLMHPCADQNGNIPHYIKLREETGWHGKYIWLFGPETPIEKQIEAFGHHDVICGNVDPPSLQFRTYNEIFELCRQNIEAGKDAPNGYILAPGCEFPPMAPPASVMAMMDAAEKFGTY